MCSCVYIIVGEHDGIFNGKRYFSCPDHHGIIVPEREVNLQPKCDVRENQMRTYCSHTSGLSLWQCNEVSVNTSRPAHGPNSFPGRRAKRSGGGLSVASRSWAQRRLRSQSEPRGSFGDFSTSTYTAGQSSKTAESAVEGGRCQSVCGATYERGGEEETATAVYSNEGDMCVEDAEEERGDINIVRSRTPVARDLAMSGVEGSALSQGGPTTLVAGGHSISLQEEGSSHSGTGQSRRYLSSQFSGLSGTVTGDSVSSSDVTSERYTHCSPSSYKSLSDKVKGHRDEGKVVSSATPLTPHTTAEPGTVESNQEQVSINQQESLTRYDFSVVSKCTNMCL